MNKSLRTFFLLVILANLTITSCKKGEECEGAFNINQSEVVVKFIDKATGKYLYSEINPMYNKDSLKVYDPHGTSLIILSALDQIPNTNNRYYVLSFGNIFNPSSDSTSFNSEICKDYTIMYSPTETDTVRVCFKSKQTKCGSVFETLNVYQKSQLISFENNKVNTNNHL
jgi:hypothetical protein